jgi:hypothetical protein
MTGKWLSPLRSDCHHCTTKRDDQIACPTLAHTIQASEASGSVRRLSVAATTRAMAARQASTTSGPRRRVSLRPLYCSCRLRA